MKYFMLRNWFVAGMVAVVLMGCGGGNQIPEELAKEIEKIDSVEDVQSVTEQQVLSDALTVVKKYAIQGNPVAMYYMAEGRVLDKADKNFVSIKAAIDWLEKSANKGHTEACFSLAELYATDKTVQNFEKSYQWFYIGYYRKDGKVASFSSEQGPQVGDFRNDTQVAGVLEKLDKKRVPQFEQKAKDWIAKHPKLP